MCDDLTNFWGGDICYPDKLRRKLKKPLENDMIGGTMRATNTTLPSLLTAETDDFIFERVSICGSTANAWCIDDATGGNASRCLIGAGCYVAGDGSALQSRSTSEFYCGEELSMIMEPDDMKFPEGRLHTIPLPYHIPGTMNAKQLKEYEDECFQAIHIRLCWAKMRSEPYKAILLELTLAGCGGGLSNRALIAIGKLAMHHQLAVIVDEIMTGGRTGAIFYLLSKPPSFQGVVTHITLGKWCKMGMIFVSKHWAEKRKVLYPFTARGASTFLCAQAAITQWRCVKECLHETLEKRNNVLKKLKLSEEQVWGEGIMMFGPVRWDNTKGLKCRYLPLIHASTPIDTVHHRLMMTGNLYKIHVNDTMIASVKKWIIDGPQPNTEAQASRLAQQWDAERLCDFAIVAKIIKGAAEEEERPSEEWIKNCMPKNTNRSEGESALGRLKEAGYVKPTQVGKKRKRCWKLQSGILAPWKSVEIDNLIYDDVVVSRVI